MFERGGRRLVAGPDGRIVRPPPRRDQRGAPVCAPRERERGLSDQAEAVERVRSPRVKAAHIRYVVGVLALAAGYYAAARISYPFEFAGPVAAIVWFPCGVGMATLYIAGLRFWPGVLIGDLIANDYAALPLGSALGQTTGNVLEALVAAIVLRRLVRDRSPLETIPNLARMIVALLAATLTSATIGTLSLRLGAVIESGDAATVWRTWLLGDFCGALVAVPLALAFLDRNRPRPRGRFGAEARRAASW